MTPLDYARTIVMPTMREALANRGDQRCAYLACIVVFHLADYIALAEAETELSLGAGGPGARRRIVELKRGIILLAVGERCGAAFDVVEGITNGTKHPERVPLLHGTERLVPGFKWETGVVEGTRWEGPGLAVMAGGEDVYIDICAQQVLGTLVALHPGYLRDLDPNPLDPWLRW